MAVPSRGLGTWEGDRRGCAGLLALVACMDRPTTSPPTALNPSPRNLGTEQLDPHRHGSTLAQALVHVRAAVAPAFGGCAGCGKLASPRGLMEKEGVRSQAPWQTALIRANDCTSPFPGCFINTAINFSKAASLASRRSDRSRRFADWGSAQATAPRQPGWRQAKPGRVKTHCVWGDRVSPGGSASTLLTPPGACAADVWEQLCASVGIFSSAATIESSF